jgi:hypothetical protein
VRLWLSAHLVSAWVGRAAPSPLSHALRSLASLCAHMLWFDGEGGGGGQERLEGSSWQEALRALCALEALLQRGGGGEVALFYQHNLQLVHAVGAAATQVEPDCPKTP